MKITRKAGFIGGINEYDRIIGIMIFGKILAGLNFGYLDHWTIIILEFHVGVIYWSDEEWEDFSR